MNASDIPVGPLIVGAVLSFALEALCSAGGAALGRVTRDEAVEAEASGARGARRISFLVARRQAAIAGLVFLRIVFAAFAALFLTLALAGVVSTWWEAALAFAGILACVTALMAVASPTGVGLRRPIQTLGLISGPAAAVTAIASRTVREREVSPEESEQVREDQLAVMVERVSQSVVLDENDRELLQSVFDLNHTLVREVMVPRTDMVTIGGDASLDKAMSLFTRSGFSRVPVVGETTDDLLGVVYLKDVLS
ncbi:MAG: CBS domain-containing protein, partial [Peptidiphaga sp.]